MTRHERGLVLVMATVLGGCAIPPGFRDVGLQRDLLPGLDDTGPGGIEGAFARKVEWKAPASAGLIWLAEDVEGVGDSPKAERLTGFERAGILEAGRNAFRGHLFSLVGELPTVEASQVVMEKDAAALLTRIRSACANFQYDIALVMRTTVARDDGFNALAVLYLPLITIPIVPGTDVAVSSSAEVIAVDVRTGMPLACGRGRDAAVDHCVFYFDEDAATLKLAEESLSRSVRVAAADVLAQLDGRLGQIKAP